jgi:secondary thiamine-phosphate synthase enzyme
MGDLTINWLKSTLSVRTSGQGLYDFTNQVNTQIRQWGVQEGIAFLFIRHTSASLIINENYDPSARQDLESYLDHLAPEDENWYIHTLEGRDDSPAHMRTMITPISLSIPIDEGRLSLGTWQGLFLAEHRQRSQHRDVLLRVLKIA